MAGNYAPLQDVAGNYASLPDVAGNYKLLPDVAGNYTLLPDVAGNYTLVPNVAGNYQPHLRFFKLKFWLSDLFYCIHLQLNSLFYGEQQGYNRSHLDV